MTTPTLAERLRQMATVMMTLDDKAAKDLREAAARLETLERENARALLLEVAGLLALLSLGMTVPNLAEQSEALLDKIGVVLAEPPTGDTDDRA